MKHDRLRSIAHNIAASLASGIGLLIGVYEMDIYGEARQSTNGRLTVDFLTAKISGGPVSESLAKAVVLYRDLFPRFCERHGTSVSEFREFTAHYFIEGIHPCFTIIVEDAKGRRSSTDYAGVVGERVAVLDDLGRIRRKPIQRSKIVRS